MLLRLAYHDAATYSIADRKGGANASIQFEFERPENMGLKRGWNVVQQVRRRQQATPPVSDIVRMHVLTAVRAAMQAAALPRRAAGARDCDMTALKRRVRY